MRLKPNFKPSIEKIIFSVLITILWWLYNLYTTEKVLCKCNPESIIKLCNIYYQLIPIKNNICCSCATLTHLLIQYLIYIIIPFIISYIVFTLLYSLLPRKHKHGRYR